MSSSSSSDDDLSKLINMLRMSSDESLRTNTANAAMSRNPQFGNPNRNNSQSSSSSGNTGNKVIKLSAPNTGNIVRNRTLQEKMETNSNVKSNPTKNNLTFYFTSAPKRNQQSAIAQAAMGRNPQLNIPTGNSNFNTPTSMTNSTNFFTDGNSGRDISMKVLSVHQNNIIKRLRQLNNTFVSSSSDSDNSSSSDSDNSSTAVFSVQDGLGAISRDKKFPDKLYEAHRRYTGINNGRPISEAQKLKKKTYGIPKSEIILPSGKTANITLPSNPSCSCDKLSNTLYIPLKSDDEEYKTIADEMNSTIKKHVSGTFTTCNVTFIKKIKNCCLWMRYKNRQRDISKENVDVNEVLLFHGSPACNEICKSGFDERHSNTRGMFGAGIYFAKHSSKSNQYVFGYMGGKGCPKHLNKMCTVCPRKMLLCRVTLGNSKRLTSADQSIAHAPPGYHSVSGVPAPGGLLYEEFIIYRGEQAYPEYEVTYTIS